MANRYISIKQKIVLHTTFVRDSDGMNIRVNCNIELLYQSFHIIIPDLMKLVKSENLKQIEYYYGLYNRKSIGNTLIIKNYEIFKL